MKIISPASLEEYASGFVQNEKRKYQDPQRLQEMDAAQRTSRALSFVPDYKRPHESFPHLFVVRIESQTELEQIRIYDRMVTNEDKWMRDRKLTPDPSKPIIGDLARYFLASGYFSIPRSDAQYVRYHDWKKRGNLTGAIAASSRPLLQGPIGSCLTVVDGWGRLLPFAALVQEGFTFVEFDCFLATHSKD